MIEPIADLKLGSEASLGYEALRFQILGKSGDHRKGSSGLALFILQGMLGWIKAWPKCALASFSSNEQMSPRPIFAYKIQSEMTKVLANITLSHLGDG